MKQKKKSGIFVNILLAVSILGLLAATIALLVIWRRYKTASDEYKDIRSEYTQEQSGQGFLDIDFDALRRINPDIVAWIDLPGTQLSYPVVQAKDNEYYLTRTFQGTYNPSGAIFMDARSEPDFSLTNTVIHGHNMKDGSMFHTLDYFIGRTGGDYMKLHSELHIYTPDGIRVYQVFAARQTDIDDPAYQYRFADKTGSDAFLAAMGGEEKGLFPGDTIVTLSTCINNYDNETPERFILQAVLEKEI